MTHESEHQNAHCHHGVAWLDGEFVSLALYDDVYQDARAERHD